MGYLKGGIEAWKAAGREVDTITSIDVETFAKELKKEDAGQVLDVRKPTEFLAQHLENARNFPLDYINSNMNRISKKDTYFLHCLGGYRSMITASILKARGFDNIIDIKGGWRAIEASDIPKTDYVCPTTIEQELLDEAIAAVA